MSHLLVVVLSAALQSQVEAMAQPALVLGAVALVLGLGLALAAKKLAVRKDPVAERIEELLPGANCGGCGYPGCPAFAEAVAEGKAPPNGCVVVGPEVDERIAKAAGQEVEESVKRIAVVRCGGGHSATDAFEYHGPPECASAMLVMGGQKTCPYGCLGFGDCVEACPFDAIRMGDGGIPVVDEESCTACGKCVDACPKGIIDLWPAENDVMVACSSKDKGGVARKACSVACIGCRKCEKACPVDAITVDDFLARIDPEKCINCGLCATECPTGAIIDKVPARPRAYIDSNCVGCAICVEVCPLDAISGEHKQRHEVDQEKCVGCGLCVSKCPTNAIRLVGALSYRRNEG